MNVRTARALVLSLCVCLLALGCQKPADQPSRADANASPSMAEAAKTAVNKAIEPKPLVVPADTVIAVVLDQTISSELLTCDLGHLSALCPCPARSDPLSVLHLSSRKPRAGLIPH